MAFEDLPKIDESSKNSETSEIKIKSFFNQQNNFICRTDIPDKGCDFDMELIIDGASNWRFPIQLKSIETLTLIKDNNFISYSFETSRLGYLIRRPICGGLVILYSVSEENCFYEYADIAYQRLIDERENEDWKKSDNVNIRIPYSNILDKDSVKKIYELFKIRFEQGVKMQMTYGIKYGLPYISEGKFQYDFTNIDHIKKFLKESGNMLLYNYDFDVLFLGISRLPTTEIISDKDILIQAIVAFGEAAHFIESEMYIGKLKKMYEISEDEDWVVSFQSLKNKLVLGQIDSPQFIEMLEKIRPKNLYSINSITIQINKLRYKIIEIKISEKISFELETECQYIFQLIDKCDCTERIKNLFRIWNCEIESMIAINRFGNDLAIDIFKENLGVPLTENEKIIKIKTFILAEKQIFIRLNEIYKWAISEKDLITKANSLSAFVTNFIQKEITFIGTGSKFFNQIDHTHELELKQMAEMALEAYNCFVKLNLIKQAYYNLCVAIEILIEAELLFDSKVEKDKLYLLSIKNEHEKNTDIKPLNFEMKQLISKVKENGNKSEDENMSFTKDMTDDHLLFFANSALESYSLPSERLENILNELKAYRLFNQRCQDQNIIILQVKEFPNMRSDFYKHPIQFILKNKLTGIESPPSNNMDKLLFSCGF